MSGFLACALKRHTKGLHGTKPGCRLILRCMQIHPDAPVHGDPGVADPGDGPGRLSSPPPIPATAAFSTLTPRSRETTKRVKAESPDSCIFGPMTRPKTPSMLPTSGCNSRCAQSKHPLHPKAGSLQGLEGGARQTRRTIFTFRHFRRQGINGEAMGRRTYSSDRTTSSNSQELRTEISAFTVGLLLADSSYPTPEDSLDEPHLKPSHHGIDVADILCAETESLMQEVHECRKSTWVTCRIS